MRKFLTILFITTLYLNLLPINHIANAQIVQDKQAAQEETTSRYIVFFKEDLDEQTIQSNGGEILQKYDSINAATIEIEENSLQELLKSGVITKASRENKVEISAQMTPWGHKTINLPAKQPETLSGKGVKIAIIDTGIDPSHPDLKVSGGYCALETALCGNSYRDENGHGTHVAGIIAAKDNEIGTVGVAPGAEIYAVKALDSDGSGTSSTIMAALDWAIKNNMDIINMSLTTSYADPGIKALIDKAYEKGMLIIAAAGNIGTPLGNTDTVLYPAKFKNVIAVSAINKYNLRISSSSTGSKVELAAPGDEIYSTFPKSIDKTGYAIMSGTSMAAPFVTGLAALYKEKYPEYTNVQIRTLLQNNAVDLGAPGKDPFYGYGLAQADTEVDAGPVFTIDYEAANNGTVKLNMQPILEVYGAYNLYRFDQLIAEEETEVFFTDYGAKGVVEYTIYPLENGAEQRKKPTRVKVHIPSPIFRDLSNSAWFSRHMVYLNTRGIVTGYEGNLMKPSQNVTRAEAVAMLGRTLGLDKTQRKTRFKDVPKSSFASGYIESAAEMGILKGRSDGTFKPNDPVTRAEMAILLSKGYGLPAAQTTTFTDVNKSIAGYQEIYNIAASGITKGYPDGTFKPSEKMLRSTYSVFLAKAENEKLRK